MQWDSARAGKTLDLKVENNNINDYLCHQYKKKEIKDRKISDMNGIKPERLRELRNWKRNVEVKGD